ncbi:hypothetical protein [Xanthomonas sp. 4461]|uniref:hypothetical protein n=1 Tax=Xanthomonas sp. 4461 TaxID=3035313 RepID=UPI00216A7C6C|nr:hypothetical protein [Xanthomonas sp. 4461]MCS3808631.1 hypothetical protein [Xanthomonas sp. 4461]
MKIIEAREGRLLNVIDWMSPLEWRRYQSREARVWNGDYFEKKDMSTYPPYVAFRFVKEDFIVVKSLMDLVAGYEGVVDWVMRGHLREVMPNTNWIIAPSFFFAAENFASSSDISMRDCISKNDAMLSLGAYKDIDLLTDYVAGRIGMTSKY